MSVGQPVVPPVSKAVPNVRDAPRQRPDHIWLRPSSEAREPIPLLLGAAVCEVKRVHATMTLVRWWNTGGYGSPCTPPPRTSGLA